MLTCSIHEVWFTSFDVLWRSSVGGKSTNLQHKPTALSIFFLSGTYWLVLASVHDIHRLVLLLQDLRHTTDTMETMIVYHSCAMDDVFINST
jgi:hypothetical protein